MTIQALIRDLGPGDWPTIEHFEHDDQQVSLRIKVPVKLDIFKGHFPDQAVLPGIVQVHWAAEIGRRIFEKHNVETNQKGFTALRGIKFNGMVVPGQKLNLVLLHTPETNKLKFEFSDLKQKYSNGTIESCGAKR